MDEDNVISHQTFYVDWTSIDREFHITTLKARVRFRQSLTRLKPPWILRAPVSV